MLTTFSSEFCCSQQNYYNVYGGQQLPFRWLPAYGQPFYGLSRQFIPTAYVKKTQFTDMSPQEFTAASLSEPISASPSISSTGSVSNQCYNFVLTKDFLNIN